MKDPARTLVALFTGLFLVGAAWYLPALYLAVPERATRAFVEMEPAGEAVSAGSATAVLLVAGAFAVLAAVTMTAVISAEWTDPYHDVHSHGA